MSEAAPDRLRLGHITYSNCFPVHARLVDRPRAGDPALVEGVPSTLNGLLADGTIDVAPSSSIEFARNADRYMILPELAIGARGAVRSIVLVSGRPPGELGGCRVSLPTASATSVVLLKILLRIRWKVQCRFDWFDQRMDDPFAAGADAALFIGDVALRAGREMPDALRLDLGAEWWDETGLPFAFAVWQASSGSPAALRGLHASLVESRAYGEAHREALAARYATHFGMRSEELGRYWADLAYHLDPSLVEGLEAFYREAVGVGELERVPVLRWID